MSLSANSPRGSLQAAQRQSVVSGAIDLQFSGSPGNYTGYPGIHWVPEEVSLHSTLVPFQLVPTGSKMETFKVANTCGKLSTT